MFEKVIAGGRAYSGLKGTCLIGPFFITAPIEMQWMWFLT